MEFRILGPLEAAKDGQALELGGRKQRVLLAMLLLAENRVVSTDRLVDGLWGDDPPQTAQKALQVHVSQLRKLVGKERLQTRPPGYVLQVAPDELDLSRCRRLMDEGKPDRALALWRGPALADLAGEAFVQPEVARLEELRLLCLEERVRGDLARGLAGELVGELEALVREHPLREALRSQLMLALYRSGRQADALDVYQHARRRLVQELGLEPGPALRALHQAILNQDASLDPTSSEQSATAEPPAGEEPVPQTLAASPPAPILRDARKTVTVVVVSTSTSAAGDGTLDPEALRRVSGIAFSDVEQAVVRHGGVVDGFAGQALTAVFGLPAVHEDDAARAVRAAADIRAALRDRADELSREHGLELAFRVGVSTGEVVTGSGHGFGARTTGEPLSRAAQLAREAGRGEIVFDGATRDLVRDTVRDRPGDGVWRLDEIRDPSSPVERRFTSPMVGRTRERRRLADAFEQAVGDRSCQLFTVLGAPGVGKSRLVHEFLGEVRESSLVGRGRCLPYGEGITYWPLLEVVSELVGLADTDSLEEACAKLAEGFGRGEGAEALALRVARLIGLAEARGGADEGHVAVRELFQALARSRPLVVVLDDIHWAEATFLDLVEQLADRLHDAPVVLLCIARPELLGIRPGWGGGKLNATTTLLEPLSSGESAELIGNLVGAGGPAERIAARIAEAAEGNPLFVEEMLSMLIDEGTLVHEHGRWVAAGDASVIRVPPTIHALLAARLDQLGPDERATIERAAVAGKVFQEGAVAALSPEDDRPALSDALASLVRKELIRPERASLGDAAYRFRHILIRDAAYDSIPKEGRAELHERFGRWLERTSAERATEYEEVLGYHLEQAYRLRAELGLLAESDRALARDAAERLGRAGRRAFVRSDAPAGVNLVSRAVSLLPPSDPLRVDLVPNVRVVQATSVDMTWADRVLTEAVEAAATAGDRRLAAHALVQRGLLRLFTEPKVTPEELIDSSGRSLAVFEELGDELGMARAWRLQGQAHYLARRAELCLETTERALEHVSRIDEPFEKREILEWLVIALLLGPTHAGRASERCSTLLETAAHDPALQALVLSGHAPLLAMQGRPDEARELKERSLSIMRELDEFIWIAFFWWGFVSLWEHDAAGAERDLRPAYEALKSRGATSHFSSLAHVLANAVYAQGRFEEAERLTHECEEASRPNDIHSHVLWRSTRAKTLARRGLLEDAELLARDAVAFADTTDFHLAHADALMDLAEVLDVAGDRKSARDAVDEAIRFYDLKGNALAAGRARSRLRIGGERGDAGGA